MNTDNPYLLQRAAVAEKFQATVKAIAIALGATYVPPKDGGDVWGTVRLSSGQEVIFHRDSRENRVRVSGSWPCNVKREQFTPQNWSTPKSEYRAINVSMDRSPEAIAKDIQRRFLPAYLTEHAVQTERAAASDEYHRTTESTLARVAKILRLPAPPRDAKTVSLYGIAGLYGHAEVSGGSVTLEVRNMTAEQAEQVLRVIASFPHE